ncbi:MAG: hypothetical protein ACRDRV_12155 [Pseudonocardiaceae bacterium]
MDTLAPLPSLLVHPVARYRARKLERDRQAERQRFAWRVQDILVGVGLGRMDSSIGGGRITRGPDVVAMSAGPPVRVSVRILPGQKPDDFIARAPAIAYNLDVAEVRVVPLSPSLIRLDLLSSPTAPPRANSQIVIPSRIPEFIGQPHHYSPVVAISPAPGRLDVFWIGPEGDVETTWTDRNVDNGRWHAPLPIAPPHAADPETGLCVITQRAGWLDVFWVGPDGEIETTWVHADEDNSWHAPVPIAPPHSAATHSNGHTTPTSTDPPA